MDLMMDEGLTSYAQLQITASAKTCGWLSRTTSQTFFTSVNFPWMLPFAPCSSMLKQLRELNADQEQQLYFWDELVYLAVLPVTKISILLFYLKIFPKREVKIAVWVLIGFNLAYLITFEVISIWQCRPIQGAWLAWDGTFEATCNDINMQGWMAAALNLVLDLATIILPLPELVSLSMSLRKKIQILSMFCVGFL